MELAAGIVVADRFRLVRPLGEGGMGAVWLAQHTGLDVPCAVKFIHEEAAKSPEVRARFEREAKAAAQLRSPHVVQILDHGVWQGSPYIAMELLEGEDLDHRLGTRRTLSPGETLAMAVQVGRALSKAHSAGLVHRDLKPANIFLVRDEEREIAKVLDFGVAKVKETGLDGRTKTGAVLGTPFYMSPEQARGSKAIDHRSDLWALAVVVYECLVGEAPFNGEALGDLFVKIIVEPLPVPSRFAPVPAGFDAWWARAASRDPALRFQTAKELTDALSLALGVTVAAGVEVGSALASGGASGGALTSRVEGYPGGRSAIDSSPVAMANTRVVGSAPTGMGQSLGVPLAPRSGRGGVWVGFLAAIVLFGGGGAFLMLRSPPKAGAAAIPATSEPATPIPSAAPPPTAPVVAPGTAAPEASVSPSASVAPTAASATAGSTHGLPHAPTGSAGAKHPPPTGGKPRTDFGF